MQEVLLLINVYEIGGNKYVSNPKQIQNNNFHDQIHSFNFFLSAHWQLEIVWPRVLNKQDSNNVVKID